MNGRQAVLPVSSYVYQLILFPTGILSSGDSLPAFIADLEHHYRIVLCL